MGKQKARPFRTREQYLAYVRLSNRTFLNERADRGKFCKVQYARGPRVRTGARDEHGLPLYGKGERQGVFVAWEDDSGGLRVGGSFRHDGFTEALILYPGGKWEPWIRPVEPRPFCSAEGINRALVRSVPWPTDGISTDGVKVPYRFTEQYYKFMYSTVQEFEEYRVKRASRDVSFSGAGVPGR